MPRTPKKRAYTKGRGAGRKSKLDFGSKPSKSFRFGEGTKLANYKRKK